MPNQYSEPVAKLLTFGGFDIHKNNEVWPNYLELGFTQEDIPELIRMMVDDDLNTADPNELRVWAPLHAWRTLGQLRAVEAVEPMVRLFDKLHDDDWLATELPKAFSLIGPASIPAVVAYLGDKSVEEIRRISAPKCLEQIVMDYADHRDECIGALETQLRHHEINGPILNAFLIMSLTKLGATNTIDTIRAAFAANTVDLSVQGDVEDVEIFMGLRTERETPPPVLEWARDFPKLGSIDDWDDASGEFPADMAINPFKHVGRNDPCPCGSGKKYKKCCLH